MRTVELAGDSRITTAVRISRFAHPEGTRAVVLCAADAFADGLAAAPLTTNLEAALLLVGRRIHPAVADEIERLGATDVVIVGAVGAVPAVVQAELVHRGLRVRRIAGESRYDTAALVARELGAGDEAAVTTGESFADSLGFAPVAAAWGIPVLLVAQGLPDDTRDALDALGVTRTILVGGPNVIDAEIMSALPRPTRIAGEDRYTTSVAVAELTLARGGSMTTVGVATGRDFSDALAAGPLLAAHTAPLLLLDGQDAGNASAVFDFLEAHVADIDRLLVFGGPDAIGQPVRERLARIGAGR